MRPQLPHRVKKWCRAEYDARPAGRVYAGVVVKWHDAHLKWRKHMSVDDVMRTAAGVGDAELLKACLDNPACDPMSKDGNGMTVLMWAASQGHLICAQMVLPQSNEFEKNERGRTALMYAAALGNASCVQLLMAKGAPLIQDRMGLTALMHAAGNGHEPCVDLLIPVSNTLEKDKDGMTALMWAAISGSPSCVEILLPVSAIGCTNNKGSTAEDMARHRSLFSNMERIQAYALAASEALDLEHASGPGRIKGDRLRV